jgi:cytochrome P450
MSITRKQLSGPKGMPFIGALHKVTISDLHNDFEKWAKEFGPVYKVDLGPSKLTIVTQPSIIQAILKARPTEFVRMKKMDRILRSEGVNGVFNAEGEEWKLHRKIIAKGLDVKHQQQFFPSMIKTVSRLHRKLVSASESNVPYSIQEDFLRFTVDITTSLAFGIEMNTLEQEGGVIQAHMEKIFPILFKRINDPLPLHKIYRTKKDKEFDHALVEINKVIDGFIATGKERLQDNPARRLNPENLLEAILLAAEEETVFGDQEIKGNLLTLLMAGEDTTAHSLAWIIFYLCQHPEEQDKLHQEANRVLGDSLFMPRYDKQTELVYTEAVIQETMRLKPVAPLLLFEATSTIELENHLFKKGEKVVVNTRAGATNDDYFSDGKYFKPERWMQNQAAKCPVHKTEAFLPFGSGARFCPGKNLAILEMKLVVSMLMKNFTLEMITPLKDIQEIMAFTMMASPFEIQVSKR